MSYCRFGTPPGSDVYAYAGYRVYVTHVSGGHVFHDRTRKRFYERLKNLKAAGFKVPRSAFARLERELRS